MNNVRDDLSAHYHMIADIDLVGSAFENDHYIREKLSRRILDGKSHVIVTSDKDGVVFSSGVVFTAGSVNLPFELHTLGTHDVEVRLEDAVKSYTLKAVVVQFAGGNGEDEPYLIANADQMMDQVTSGASVILTYGPKVQMIRLHLLSDLVRKELDLQASEPITIGRVAEYVIGSRSDVTGDGEFDRLDVWILLYEMD